MRRFRAAIVFALLTCGGCASQPTWVNPAVPQDRRSADLAQCRREAEDDMGPGAATAPGDEHSGNPMALVDRTNTAKRFEGLVGSCMQDKGYHRAD